MIYLPFFWRKKFKIKKLLPNPYQQHQNLFHTLTRVTRFLPIIKIPLSLRKSKEEKEKRSQIYKDDTVFMNLNLKLNDSISFVVFMLLKKHIIQEKEYIKFMVFSLILHKIRYKKKSNDPFKTTVRKSIHLLLI